MAALHGLLLEMEPVRQLAKPLVSDGTVLPGRTGKKAAVSPTPPEHLPLLRALQEVPPPKRWRACASRIVQLSVDWYVGPEAATDHPKIEVLQAVHRIEGHKVWFNSFGGGCGPCARSFECLCFQQAVLGDGYAS